MFGNICRYLFVLSAACACTQHPAAGQAAQPASPPVLAAPSWGVSSLRGLAIAKAFWASTDARELVAPPVFENGAPSRPIDVVLPRPEAVPGAPTRPAQFQHFLTLTTLDGTRPRVTFFVAIWSVPSLPARLLRVTADYRSAVDPVPVSLKVSYGEQPTAEVLAHYCQDTSLRRTLRLPFSAVPRL